MNSDGIADGILLDPRLCEFDPAELTCPAGTDHDACLTGPQVEAVQKIWSGIRDSSGEVVFPGLVPGGEAAPGGWSRWVTGNRTIHLIALAGWRRLLSLVCLRRCRLGLHQLPILIGISNMHWPRWVRR